MAAELTGGTRIYRPARLVTLNARHFPMVEVEVPY